MRHDPNWYYQKDLNPGHVGLNSIVSQAVNELRQDMLQVTNPPEVPRQQPRGLRHAPWEMCSVYWHRKQEALFPASYNLLPTCSKVASLDEGLQSPESQEAQSSICACPCLGPQSPPHWTRVTERLTGT